MDFKKFGLSVAAVIVGVAVYNIAVGFFNKPAA
jgi:hypothetical protein